MNEDAGGGVERLVVFGRLLRDEGLAVGTGRINDFCRAAALLPPQDLYWAGRGTLVARRDDIPVYDRVFRAFFGQEPPVAAAAAESPPVRLRSESSADAEQGTEGEQDVRPEVLLASAVCLALNSISAECSVRSIRR